VPRVLARFPGMRTAKVKAAEPALADDIARIEAVRAAGPDGAGQRRRRHLKRCDSGAASARTMTGSPESPLARSTCNPAVIRSLQLATEEDLAGADDGARDDDGPPQTWMSSV
jgi:o-succinylbenzoate synthase